MKRKSSSRKKILPKKSKKDCPYCNSKTIPDYKSYDELKKFISERGKMIPSIYTGVCSKHQRMLNKAIKRARYLGLLSYTPIS